MRRKVLAIACVLALPPAAAAQVWSTHQGNTSHTGYVPVAITSRGIQHLWSRTFTGALNPVAIAGGRVFASETGYFFQANQGLHAIDARTGSTAWSYPDFGAVFSVNPPAYANGTVYLQTGKGTISPADPYLYAFDGATGTPRFRVPFAAQWEQYLAPTPYLSDVFINGGTYGGAYRFDGADGTQRWYAGLPQYDGWTPAVDANYAYAYLGSYAPGLYVLYRATGAPAFTIPDPQFQWGGWTMGMAPVLTHDGDILATNGGRLIRFDVQGQVIQWQVARNFQGQVTLKGDVIYANDGGTFTAWNAQTGGLLWTWLGPGGASVTGNIVVTDTHAFVQSPTTTYAVDLATRRVDWSYAAAGHVALGDGVLAIVDDKSLHVFAVDIDPTLPLPPEGLRINTIAGNQVTVRFTEPTAGAVPTSYVLEGGATPGEVLATLPLAGVQEHTISVPAGVFYVRVRSVAGNAISAPSSEIRLVVNESLPPSTPTSLTGLASGSTLRLGWRNTFDGGLVDRVVLDVSGAITTSLVLGATETFTFDGVPPGTYDFKVRAGNAAGSSAASAAVTLSFPGFCSGSPQPPADVLAYRVGNVVHVSWNPPTSGSAAASYVVDVTGAFAGSFAVTGRAIGGAVGPGTYHLTVAAVNNCGTSAASAAQTVVVP